jgi:GTP cyclohydrolase IB
MPLNAPEKMSLPDTQSQPDARHLAIQRVGVKGLRYPIAIKSGGEFVQHTVAVFSMYVGLPHDVKGTHMSRFVEMLEAVRAPLDLVAFRNLQSPMIDRLDAQTGSIAMRFPYFIRKNAPVSAVESLVDYDVTWIADTTGAHPRLSMQVTAPVTSLCPCSKKISSYGAHN